MHLGFYLVYAIVIVLRFQSFCINTMSEKKLRDFFENIDMYTPGYEIEYRGYTLQKHGEEGDIPPDHSECKVINTDGTVVESLSVGAYRNNYEDSFENFRQVLDDIIEYDPDSLEDWLNR